MKMGGWIVTALLLALTTVELVRFFGDSDESEPPPDGPTAPAAEPQVTPTATGERMVRLEARLADLEWAAREDGERESSDRPERGGHADAGPGEPTSEEIRPASEQLEQALAEESFDPDWSSDFEYEVQEVFEDSPEMSEQSTLVDIECKSTMCRMVVSHETAEAAARFSNELPFALPRRTSGHVERAGTEAAPESIVYVTDRGR